jgi:membrane-associated phospholipid phosphatase
MTAPRVPRKDPGPSYGSAAKARTELLLAAGAGLLLALLTVAIAVRHGRPFPLDSSLHSWAVSHRPRTIREPAIIVTSTGVGVVPYALAGTAGAIPGRGSYGRVVMAVLAMVFLLVVQTLRFGLVTTVGRVRPPASDWAVHVAGFAFPSGHTVTSATAAGLLVWVACLRLHGAWRTAVVSCAAAWALAVGLTRVYLGVHWPTDVAGGWLFTITAFGLAAWVRSRGGRPPQRRPGTSRRRAGGGLPPLEER